VFAVLWDIGIRRFKANKSFFMKATLAGETGSRRFTSATQRFVEANLIASVDCEPHVNSTRSGVRDAAMRVPGDRESQTTRKLNNDEKYSSCRIDSDADDDFRTGTGGNGRAERVVRVQGD
jgi:hypothetical protein